MCPSLLDPAPRLLHSAELIQIRTSVSGKTKDIIYDKLDTAEAGSKKETRERGVQRTRAKEMEGQATKVSPGATEEAWRDPYKKIV